MFRFTIISRTRATVARIASLIMLSMVFASFTVTVPATPASAGGSDTACVNVLPDIAGWAWVTSPQPELVFFPAEAGYPDYAIGIDVPIPSNPSPSWSGVDNPTPLRWLVAHYPDYVQVFGNLFSSCEVYSPQLVDTMNIDHFAPSMVGGTNPAGVTSTGTPPVVQPPAPTPSPSPPPQPSPAPQPQPSPQPTPPAQSQSSVTPTEPPTLLTPPPYVTAQHIAQIWSRDAQLVAQSGHGNGQGNGSGSGSGSGRGKHHGRPWSDYAGIIAAILVIASAIWWRRRVARRRW